MMVVTSPTTSAAAAMTTKSCLVWLSIVDAPLTPQVVAPPAARRYGSAGPVRRRAGSLGAAPWYRSLPCSWGVSLNKAAQARLFYGQRNLAGRFKSKNSLNLQQAHPVRTGL